MSSEKVLIGKQDINAPENCELTVVIKDETHTLTVSTKQAILDSLLEAKISPPFSCMTGSCCACMATIEDGQVYQEIQGGLPDTEKKERTLTCQALPISEKLKIVY